MLKEPKTMAELHKIREEHYEETKEKPLSSVLGEIAKEAEAVIRKHNLRLRYLTKLETTGR